jgi:hypothetical protein
MARISFENAYRTRILSNWLLNPTIGRLLETNAGCRLGVRELVVWAYDDGAIYHSDC